MSCLVVYCSLKEVKTFPESPQKPAGVLLSILGHVGMRGTRRKQKNALARLKLDHFKKWFSAQLVNFLAESIKAFSPLT